MRSLEIEDFEIKPIGTVSQAFLKQGAFTFLKALKWVHELPYGRNSNRGDFLLIFKEFKGACSTKHAALAALCKENQQRAQLMLALCKLNTDLDPKVSSFLDSLGVDYFPEAHTYLHYQGLDLDVTFKDQPPYLKVEVLKSIFLEPSQIGDYKVHLHQQYVQSWMKEKKLQLSFDQLWKLREEWIFSLREQV